jgi:hypothetical protein
MSYIVKYNTASGDGTIVNSEMERMQKKAVAVSFQMLSQHWQQQSKPLTIASL